MVSWDDSANSTAGASVGTETTHDSEVDTKDAARLFSSAFLNNWETLLLQVEASSADSIRNAVDDPEGERSSLLHVVLSFEKVPSQLVERILSKGQVVELENAMLRIPLHIAMHAIPERTDIIASLVQAGPHTVRHRDVLRLRPIDILTQKIIMMEEVIKYSRDKTRQKITLERVWDTVHVLVTGSLESPPLLVHSCLGGLDIPFALTQRAMRRYPDQLQQVDSNGDLPLHVVARKSPLHTDDLSPTTTEQSDEDDDEGDFLDRVASLYPQAAKHVNHKQQIPLVIAIQSGRRWNSGVARLLQEHPAGIDELQLIPTLYPLLLARLGQHHHTGTLFAILQSKPELFLSST